MPTTIITDELDKIARLLEGIAGIDPGALIRDPELQTRLRRIREALEATLGLYVTTANSARTITFTIQDPENTKTHAGRATKSFPAWLNDSGLTFNVTKVYAISDASGYTFILYKSNSDADIGITNDVVLGSFACSTAGTGGYYVLSTGTPLFSVETGRWIIWEHSAGTAEVLTIMIEGYYD